MNDLIVKALAWVQVAGVQLLALLQTDLEQASTQLTGHI